MSDRRITFSPAYRWTSLVGAGLRTYLAGRVSLLSHTRHWQENSAGIQLAQLRNLLRQASATEIGKKHGFARLAQLDQPDLLAAYRAEVPVADWYAYKDEIRADARGGAEPDVLWPGLVQDFAQTSGTTAGDKFIPVSREMLRSNFLASLDIFANLHRFGVSAAADARGQESFPRRLDGPRRLTSTASAPATSQGSSRRSSAGR
jgi:hypothetical protein